MNEKQEGKEGELLPTAPPILFLFSLLFSVLCLLFLVVLLVAFFFWSFPSFLS